MPYNDALTNLAQSVYLVIKNRYYDDIASDDGQTYISQIIDWGNQWFDELENSTDNRGKPIYWKFLRQFNYEIGTAAVGEDSIDLEPTVNAVIPAPRRPLSLTVNDQVLSSFRVVEPNLLYVVTGEMSNTSKTSQLGSTLVFDRKFTSAEDGGLITGDVMINVPRLSATNISALRLVKPNLLLILGIAKNATLPDIVQGGLSPSYTQKYNDLLQSAILKNNFGAEGDTIEREGYGFVRGIR